MKLYIPRTSLLEALSPPTTLQTHSTLQPINILGVRP
jgi:hypothetical protein